MCGIFNIQNNVPMNNKIERINLRLRQAAKEAIEKRASDKGVSVAKFIRMKCIDDPGLW